MGQLHPNFIVGIGGSAGALNACKELLDALPSTTGMAFFLVSQIRPTAINHLAHILSGDTKMPVILAAAAKPIRANHVYVIPPNADFLIESYTFKVAVPRTGRNKRLDFFFISLAEAMGARAIGIILSGYGGDGTEGCNRIKANGGKTFAQDMSAQVEGMPLSAQASGCIDFVLPPDKIPAELQRLVRTIATPEEALLNAGALQSAIFNSANVSSIATDAKGVIQIFNVGAERMLGYAAADVMNKITPADISDSQEVIARAKALSIEIGTPITPGFEALVFKAARGIEDIYELTYIRKDGSRFPAVVSVTALRDAQNAIIGYLLIGTELKAGALQSAIF